MGRAGLETGKKKPTNKLKEKEIENFFTQFIMTDCIDADYRTVDSFIRLSTAQLLE